MMNTQGALREAQRLRIRMQMDNRLRLEVLAALSKTFRDNRQQVSDDLLRSLVFAVPQELPGEGEASKTARGGNGRTTLDAAGQKVPPKPGYGRVPPQPGGGRVPPQPGRGRGVPPQPGKGKGKGKKR